MIRGAESAPEPWLERYHHMRASGHLAALASSAQVAMGMEAALMRAHNEASGGNSHTIPIPDPNLPLLPRLRAFHAATRDPDAGGSSSSEAAMFGAMRADPHSDFVGVTACPNSSCSWYAFSFIVLCCCWSSYRDLFDDFGFSV